MSSHPPRRLVLLCVLAAALGLASGGTAWVLIKFIAILTNLALFHQWGTTLPSFADLPIGPGVVLAAVAGAVVVTLLARWSPIIRGHGIPEAMEAVLTKRSKVAPRTAVAKPASAAVAIGTGGPFGAEGPIIVTGGALGSLFGQVVARVGERAQDPAGLRRGRWHGRHVRHAARRGGAGHRAAAVRVLGSRASSRSRGDERGRRRARAALRQRAAVHGARPQVHRPRPAPTVRRARAGLRPAWPCSSPAACSPSRACSAGCRSARPGTRWWGPWCGRRSACWCRVPWVSATT